MHPQQYTWENVLQTQMTKLSSKNLLGLLSLVKGYDHKTAETKALWFFIELVAQCLFVHATHTQCFVPSKRHVNITYEHLALYKIIEDCTIEFDNKMTQICLPTSLLLFEILPSLYIGQAHHRLYDISIRFFHSCTRRV